MNTPDYQLKLDGKEIPLRFNSRAFRNYTLSKGIEYEDLVENVASGKIFRANNIPDIIFYGAQSYAASNKLPFNYTIDDVMDWVDEMGGLASGPVIDIFKCFTGNLLRIPPEKFEAIWNGAVNQTPEEPKKKVKGTRTDTPGTSSTPMLRQVV